MLLFPKYSKYKYSDLSLFTKQQLNSCLV